MFKRMILVLAALFISAALVGSNTYAADYKIAYVDMAKVFGDYNKTKESEKTLDDKGKAKEADRKKLVDEVRKLKDEQALLSDKAKAEKQNVIDERIKTLQDFDRKTRDDLLKERNDKLAAILKDIEKVVTDYSKEAGYDFILDSRTILYGKETYDLTDEVLKRLNK